MVTEAERERLKIYLSNWQENRERLAVLPSHRGKQLRIEWTGFELHIDDKLWPQPGTKHPAKATLELAIAGQVEVLAPDSGKESG